MKQIFHLTFLLLLATCFIGCKQSEADRYERYLESLEDSTGMEFITPAKDSVELDVFGSEDNDLESDDELITVPEIPQEREIDMNANSYDLERVMMGKE